MILNKLQDILFILYKGKGSDGVAIAINVIKLLITEESFVVFMFEKFPFDSEPAIGISHKLFVVAHWRHHLQVEIG